MKIKKVIYNICMCVCDFEFVERIPFEKIVSVPIQIQVQCQRDKLQNEKNEGKGLVVSFCLILQFFFYLCSKTIISFDFYVLLSSSRAQDKNGERKSKVIGDIRMFIKVVQTQMFIFYLLCLSFCFTVMTFSNVSLFCNIKCVPFQFAFVLPSCSYTMKDVSTRIATKFRTIDFTLERFEHGQIHEGYTQIFAFFLLRYLQNQLVVLFSVYHIKRIVCSFDSL